MQAYASGLVDYHLITDLLPALAAAWFCGKLPVTLSAGQAAILLCLGLQQLELAEVAKALDLPPAQVLALFGKVRPARRARRSVWALGRAGSAARAPPVHPASIWGFSGCRGGMRGMRPGHSRAGCVPSMQSPTWRAPELES